MSQWKKVKVGDICRIVKGTTGIASAEPGEYPLVVTAEERKTCSSYQFDQEAVCIPLVSSSGHGRKSLKNVHYQSGKFALGTILCAVIPNKPEQLDTRFLHQYLQFYKDTILVPLMKGAANVSLSMKDIAAVEIPLPPIEKQRELSGLFITLRENQKNLAAETEKQFEYTKQLRQNILQDAIEGELTADLSCRQTGWRKHSFKNLSRKLVSEVSDKYFAYVLECDDGSLYKGFAQNLFERIYRHLEGRGSEWTAKHIPVSLIYFEEFDTEKEALEREKYFKSDSGREYINEIRNRNKLDYDVEALFEKIQEGKVSPSLPSQVAPRIAPASSVDSLRFVGLSATTSADSNVARNTRSKKMSTVTDEEKSFEIPNGWKWVRLYNVLNLINGRAYKQEELLTKGKYKVLRVGNFFTNDRWYYSDLELEESKYCNYGDLLYAWSASFGPRIWDKDKTIFHYHIWKVDFDNKYLYKKYLFYFLLNDVRFIKSYTTGSTMVHVSMTNMLPRLFVLPPLKEQEEIVTKVETLLAKVTELENQIQKRKTLSEKLAFGIIKEKLEG